VLLGKTRALPPPPPDTIEIEIAPERKADLKDKATPLHLRLNDLHRICALQSVAGEGMPADEYRSLIEEFASDLTPAETSEIIRHLQSDGMTAEERALPTLTRPRLMRLPNWPS
jgi:hypothetical protein